MYHTFPSPWMCNLYFKYNSELYCSFDLFISHLDYICIFSSGLAASDDASDLSKSHNSFGGFKAYSPLHHSIFLDICVVSSLLRPYSLNTQVWGLRILLCEALFSLPVWNSIPSPVLLFLFSAFPFLCSTNRYLQGYIF